MPSPRPRRARKSRQPQIGDARVRATILELVDNQVQADNPPEVRRTLERLVNGGMSDAKARQYISLALLFLMNDMLATNTLFDEAKYNTYLQRLPLMPWSDDPAPRRRRTPGPG